MASSSVVPAVMVALKAQLQARAGLAGVQITDGVPRKEEKEYIAILGAKDHSQRQAGMRATSPRPREEEFTLEIGISVLRSGDAEHTEATARVYQLAKELEDQLQDDQTISSSLGASGWATVTSLPVRKPGPDNDGRREAIVEAEIRCHARIT